MIRRAFEKDIPRLIVLGEEFAEISQPVHTFKVSREKIIQFVNDAVREVNYVTLVLEDESKEIQGFITGVIQEIYFSKDVALQEMAWYVRKGFKGIRMLEAFQETAKLIGCQKVIVGNKPQFYDLQRFYERDGFTLLEQHYVKSLGGY